MIRTLDLFFAVTGLIALSPLILILFCACLVDSKSPIVTQTRVGRYSRPFTIIKFRTMHVGTNSLGTHLVPDSSVTSVGRILRKFKLDELPQLINVARGEMSLVGPRPCLLNQSELIALRESKGILNLRPGITGLPQILGIDMSEPAKLVEWEVRMRDQMTTFKYFQYILLTALGRSIGDKTIQNHPEG